MGQVAGNPKASVANIAIGVAIATAAVAAVVAVATLDTTGRSGNRLSEEWVNDYSPYMKTDPALVLYEETGSIETGLEEARGIAVDRRDNILVVGDRALMQFSPEGGPPTLVLDYRTPLRCVAVAPDGAVYVGGAGHLEGTGPGGFESSVKVVFDAKLPEGCEVFGIAVGEKDVFVADAGNKVVLHFDRDANLLGRIGERNEAVGIPGIVIYQWCFDVALAGSGLLKVANPGRHSVETYAFDGRLVSSWGKQAAEIDGFCGCCNPVSIAMLPDGSVVTAEKFLPRVKVYDAAGKFVGVVAGVESFKEGTKGIDLAVDSAGRVLVLDPAAKAVRIFTRKGAGDTAAP